MSRTGKPIETESRRVVPSSWREWGVGRECLIGSGFYFGVMETFWN